METRLIDVPSLEVWVKLFGTLDENINIISKMLNVSIINQNGQNYLSGERDNVEVAQNVIKKLIDMILAGEHIDAGRVTYICQCAMEGKIAAVDELMHGIIAITNRGRVIKSRTSGQKRYADAIKSKTITFGVGPAGTGKTYLAVAIAVTALKNKEIDTIILTRPAVEAGEKLGFLPGDLKEKVDPYLRPLYDALNEMFGYDNFQKQLEKGIVEIAPLAYMRGRTLSNAFIILDEAQNTTREQMKMFLTRLGENSKMVINGDVTQIDLPPGKISGLNHAVSVLNNIENIAICRLTERDVVRHPLVQSIVKAYEIAESSNPPDKRQSFLRTNIRKQY